MNSQQNQSSQLNIPQQPEPSIQPEMPKKTNLPNWVSILVITLAAIIAVGLVSYGAYRYFAFQSEPAELPLADEEEPVDEFADWQTYRNEDYEFEVRYPADWKLTEEIGLAIFLLRPPGLEKISDTLLAIHPVGHGGSDSPSITKDFEQTVFAGKSSEEFLLTFEGGVLREFRILEIEGKWTEYNNIFYTVENKDKNLIPVFDQILSTFKFIETDQTADWQTYRNEKYGFEFKYPKDWGEYHKTFRDFSMGEHESLFGLNRGIIYYFDNSRFRISLEHKDFRFEENRRWYSFSLDYLPVVFGKIGNIDTYCDNIKNEDGQFIINCQIIELDTKKGILRNDVLCNGSPTGGDISCNFYRILLLNTENIDYPVLIINTFLGYYNDYEICEDSLSVDISNEKCRDQLEKALEKNQEEIENFDQILSTFKSVKPESVIKPESTTSYKIYKGDFFEVDYSSAIWTEENCQYQLCSVEFGDDQCVISAGLWRNKPWNPINITSWEIGEYSPQVKEWAKGSSSFRGDIVNEIEVIFDIEDIGTRSFSLFISSPDLYEECQGNFKELLSTVRFIK